MAAGRHRLIFILIAGFNLICAAEGRAQSADPFQNEQVLSTPLTEEELEKSNLVEVQPLAVMPNEKTSGNIYHLLPYRARRQKWGQQFAIGASMYQPTNY